MEDANNVDLFQFRNWFTQSGTPTVSIETDYNGLSHTLYLYVKQSCSMAPDRTVMEPFDIPFAIGAILAQGELVLETDNPAYNSKTGVLRITKPEETFVFRNVPYEPALSLNRNFAPVNVKYEYSEGELALLMAHDTSSFSRWDASQIFGTKVLLGLIEDIKANRKLVLDPSFALAFGAVLQEEGIDNILLSEMMALPSNQSSRICVKM